MKEATAALDLKHLAREYGDPAYRIGAKPFGWVPATTSEDELNHAPVLSNWSLARVSGDVGLALVGSVKRHPRLPGHITGVIQ